jgi:hypothetical protein
VQFLREPQELVLIVRLHLPGDDGLADLGHCFVGPMTRGVDITDHLLGRYIKVGSVNLEVHL